MRILIIGATGFVGSGIARALKADGHRVAGLARSTVGEATLRAAGVEPVAGNVAETTRLIETAKDFDALVFAPMIPYQNEPPLVTALLDAYTGSSRIFVFTSGTGVLASPALEGEWCQDTFAEDDTFTPPPWLKVRVQTEQLIRHRASTEPVRAMIVRPPLVWGHGGSKQVPAIFDSVTATGDACYIGRGLNLYSNVHIDDLAKVFSLVLEKGVSGELYHAVAGEANFRAIAEAVAETTGTRARSVNYRQACDIWGEFIVQFGFAVNSRSRSVRTREQLGWIPEHLDLIDDIRRGSYREKFVRQNN